jgi:hypothetical protein
MEDQFITVKLPNQSSMIVSVTPVRTRDSDPEQDVVDIEKVFRFEEIQNAIEGIGEMVIAALSKIRPQKAVVEFGIEVGLESGQLTALLVKGNAKSNLKITLEWAGEK